MQSAKHAGSRRQVIQNKTIYIAHGWSDVSVNQQSKALALALSKNNEVVFLNARKAGYKSVQVNENLLVLEWPGKRPTGIRDFFFAIKLMAGNKPEIIITNFAANDIMLFVSWLFGVKNRVCYFHTMVEQHIADHKTLEFRQRINIFRKGFVFRMATHMLPLTTASKRDLIKYYKVKENKTFIFPNALHDTEKRNKSNNNTIGFLGRLDHSKGVDILIEAFNKVSDRMENVRLEIAGKGVKEAELKKQVKALGLNEKVLFTGVVSYSEVLDFLCSVNFLVVPSRTDNLPTVLLEALSVAMPVIGSNGGGIPDIITSGYNGLLFKNGDINDLSEKMIQLLNNRALRDLMAENARKVFEEKYCIDDLLKRFEKLIEEEV